ncbi:MAG TPA: DUF3482 domain-containing protein [Sulfurovum sp.]|nr:DUF3482 domain-containing protein [Sulfurovum sp.]
MAENINTTYPRFAVVGHPNKGKSSIVASLAFDDSVQISDTPGTTTKVRSFPLKVDGRVLYELFDTPGFQRARKVLAWLEQRSVPADRRAEAVRAFINEHMDDERFSDEIELLTPIMDGAGIIYVVDGSKPYADEYEVEMEILRWTGQPSMALINLIGEQSYVDEWRKALGQYFKMVRQFDPMQADFTQHISLLESIAQLKEEWTSPVKESIKIFENYHEQMFNRSAEAISGLVYKSLMHIEQLKFKGEDAEDSDKHIIQQKYQKSLREMEQKTQKEVEKVWNHTYLDKEQELLLFDGVDLFSKESASIFGLTRKELVITGATGGAVAGAGIDLLFAGHTLLLGGAIGAIVGGVGAYWGFDELSDIKVLGKRIGDRYLEMGPMENRNFPYILLGRSLYHAHTLINRSHAKRGLVEFDMDESFKLQWLDDDTRKALEKLHKKFRSAKDIDTEDIKEYEELVLKSLKKVASSDNT